MILQVNLRDPRDCLQWFQVGSLLIGACAVAGLLGESLVRLDRETWQGDGTGTSCRLARMRYLNNLLLMTTLLSSTCPMPCLLP